MSVIRILNHRVNDDMAGRMALCDRRWLHMLKQVHIFHPISFLENLIPLIPSWRSGIP